MLSVRWSRKLPLLAQVKLPSMLTHAQKHTWTICAVAGQRRQSLPLALNWLDPAEVLFPFCVNVLDFLWLATAELPIVS